MGSTWALWRKNTRGKIMAKKEKRTNRLQKMGGGKHVVARQWRDIFFLEGGGDVFVFNFFS